MKKMLNYTLMTEKIIRFTHVIEKINDFLSSLF